MKPEEISRRIQEKEAKAHAQILEMVRSFECIDTDTYCLLYSLLTKANLVDLHLVLSIDRQDELCLIEIHFGHIMSSVVVNLFAITVQYVAADLQIDVALSCVDVCEVFTSWLNLIYLI